LIDEFQNLPDRLAMDMRLVACNRDDHGTTGVYVVTRAATRLSTHKTILFEKQVQILETHLPGIIADLL
jgi:hypothetical protein